MGARCVRRTSQALFRRPERVRAVRRTRVEKKLAPKVKYTRERAQTRFLLQLSDDHRRLQSLG